MSIIFNVWGRELRSRQDASERAMKALRDNPRIQNLYVAIFLSKNLYGNYETFYQARWYDYSEARNRAAKQREAQAIAKERERLNPSCQCQCGHMGCASNQ